MQGLIGGFASGDPSAIQSRRGFDFASFVLALGPKVWLDAKTLAPGLLASWTDLSGNSLGPTAAGAQRPTVSGGEVVFGGTQYMSTPAFSMGTRSSGAVAWRAGGTNQAAVQFGAINGHTSALVQDTGAGNQLRIRSSLTGADPAIAVASFPVRAVCAWSYDTTGGSVYINGSLFSMPANAITAQTAALSVGHLGGSVFSLVGAIGEVILIDGVISGASLLTLSQAMQARWS